MRQMQVLAGRNVTLFWKNRTNVLLSFLSIAVVIGLYVIFLRDFIMQLVVDAGVEAQYVKEFTDRLMVSGLLIVINTITCFGIMQLSVEDAAVGIRRDFLAAPVTRFQLTAGYWASSVMVSFFFTCFTLGGAEVFFTVYYGNGSGLDIRMKCLGTLFFSSCMNAGLLLGMIKFMKDTTSFSTYGNLYGLLCGFLAGAYFPCVMYPEQLRSLLFYFPPMQLTSIMRKLYLSGYEREGSRIGEQLYPMFGVNLIKHGETVAIEEQWSCLIVAMAIVLVIVRIENREEHLFRQ